MFAEVLKAYLGDECSPLGSSHSTQPIVGEWSFDAGKALSVAQVKDRNSSWRTLRSKPVPFSWAPTATKVINFHVRLSLREVSGDAFVLSWDLDTTDVLMEDFDHVDISLSGCAVAISDDDVELLLIEPHTYNAAGNSSIGDCTAYTMQQEHPIFRSVLRGEPLRCILKMRSFMSKHSETLRSI